jgi:putative ABC transport system permease protein
MGLFRYNLSLAGKSLRRDRGFSFAMVVSFAVAATIWAAASANYVRTYHAERPGSPDLHHVELVRAGRAFRVFRDHTLAPFEGTFRTRVSFPEYEALAGTGIPSREAATFRARVVVSGGTATTPAHRPARFASAAFFSMFERRFRYGAGWSEAAERAGAQVVVLTSLANEQLFGGEESVGRSLTIEGRPFRVVGVLAGHQPFRPYWDLGAMGSDQPAVYLPLPLARPLAVRPETVVLGRPVEPGLEALFRSEAIFVSFWAELPTDEAKRAYRRHLEARFGVGAFHLRARDRFHDAFPVPPTPIGFFEFLCGLVLVAGGFNMARLFLAKGLMRAPELGIHRALGATRGALFAREMLEASLISVGAALLAVVLYVPFSALFEAVVADTDIPLDVTPQLLLLTVLPTIGVGLVGALYPAWRIAGTRPTVYTGRS